MSRFLSFAFVFVAFVAISAPSNGQTGVWTDDDPATSGVSGFAGGLTVTPIADPTGDASRTTVGDVSTSATTQQFSNIGPAPSNALTVPASFIGKPYTFTIDFYVPSSSSMQNELSQRFFTSLDFRDASDVSVDQQNNGFHGYATGVALDTWQTLQITGNVPTGADDVVPLLVFNNGNSDHAGTEIYIDNINFSVDEDAVPRVTIQNLDLRGTGVFGGGADDAGAGTYGNHTVNASAITINGAALPGGPRTNSATYDPMNPAADGSDQTLDMQMTYSNLDLDFDGTTNDAVTFTVRFERVDFDGDGLDGGVLASFGQGFDTGFGNLNDLQVSVINVTGTTTDSGSTIYFDGFSGAGIGAGSTTDIDRTVEVNGETVTFAVPSIGGFQFSTMTLDFTEPVATLELDNSGDTDFDGMGDGGLGSIVARNYDLQFSLTDPNAPDTMKGDADLSGVVDFSDIPAFITVLQSGVFQAESDCDCSGTVDFSDIPAFILILQAG